MPHTTYYVISSEPVAPRRGWATVQVRDYPGRTNQGGQVVEDGWLGTTNEIAEHALGRYDRIDDAIAAVRDRISAPVADRVREQITERGEPRHGIFASVEYTSDAGA